MNDILVILDGKVGFFHMYAFSRSLSRWAAVEKFADIDVRRIKRGCGGV